MENILIPGILKITGKKYGFNKKNLPIYKFIPLVSTFENLLVASSLTGKDKFVCVKFIKKESDKNYGQIFIMIGDTDVYENRCEILLFKWSLTYKNINKINLFQNYLLTKSYFQYKDYTNINDCFSIDPTNCKDIDDAISYQILDNNNLILGIHIADVSYYLTKELEKTISERCFTTYLPHKIINMLPIELAENYCSLLENKVRTTLTVFFNITYDINNNLFTINDSKIEKTLIKNKKKYDYDEAENIFNNNHILYNLSKIIGKQILKINNIDNWNTHKMIEILMILTNNYIANILNSKNVDNIIYRIQEEKFSDNINHEQLKNIIGIINNNKAIYSYDNKNHFNLGLDNYTHFTSPIRRYIDIYIHKLIKKYILNDTNINIDDIPNLNYINKYEKNLKLFENDITVNKFINYILLSDESYKKCEIYIFNIDGIKLNIYIKEFKLFYRYELFKNDIINMIDIKIDENENRYLFINNTDNTIYNLYLFKKMYVNIYAKADRSKLYFDFLNIMP